MQVARLALLILSALPSLSFSQDIDDQAGHYAPTPALSYPHGVKSLRDVTFAEPSGFRPLTLDLYLPSGKKEKSLVVFIHGGAWRHRTAREGGTFRDFPSVLAAVAARGYVVASVNYRLAGEARYPGAVQDVELSIQWLRKHAAEYHIDPKRVVLWGSSAGGHMASILGTGCGDIAQPSQKECVQGVIDWYGIIDLEMSSETPLVSAYLGCEVHQCPQDTLRSANAMNFVDAKDPPFLIQHGAADVTVPPQQAQKLYDSLHAAGAPAEIILYPGVSHGFAKVPGGGPDDAINQQALQKVFEFLDRVAR